MSENGLAAIWFSISWMTRPNAISTNGLNGTADFFDNAGKLIGREGFGAGSGNRTRTLSLEGSYDTISPYPLSTSRNTQAVYEGQLELHKKKRRPRPAFEISKF